MLGLAEMLVTRTSRDDDEDIDFSDIPEIDEEAMMRARRMPPRIPNVPGANRRLPDFMHAMCSYPTSIRCARSGESHSENKLGMRPMQQRAYDRRGEQYLLIKSPPASGKGRALTYIALDKIYRQGLRQAIVAVPERAMGTGFADASLSECGFWADWKVLPRWNLCDAPGADHSKARSMGDFLGSEDRILLCTHAALYLAMKQYGTEAFDNRLVAVDELYHGPSVAGVSLGAQLTGLIDRGKSHIVATTGSCALGSAEPILRPSDEARFETVTHTYYEQLNGYRHLKYVNIDCLFYTGSCAEAVVNAYSANLKTVIHIPGVDSRGAKRERMRDVEDILASLGDHIGPDPKTGFQLVCTEYGDLLRVANLAGDASADRDKTVASLQDRVRMHDPDYVDAIITFGMAREDFDWNWCERVLTLGVGESLSETAQVMGRVFRDTPENFNPKLHVLLAAPDTSVKGIAEAMDETLKAIAACMLMDQILAPRFKFTTKLPESTPEEEFDYGESGYVPSQCNVGFNAKTGVLQVEVENLKQPTSREAQRVCEYDLIEVVAAFAQNTKAVECGVMDEDAFPEEIALDYMGQAVAIKYPSFSEENREAIRDHAIAALNLVQAAKHCRPDDKVFMQDSYSSTMLTGIRQCASLAGNLSIEQIKKADPFESPYAILSKAVTVEPRLAKHPQRYYEAHRQGKGYR